MNPCDPPSGLLLVVEEDLLAQLKHELVKAEIDLGLDLVVEELLAEVRQGVVSRVVIQVKRVQHAPVVEREYVCCRLTLLTSIIIRFRVLLIRRDIINWNLKKMQTHFIERIVS